MLAEGIAIDGSVAAGWVAWDGLDGMMRKSAEQVGTVQITPIMISSL